MLMLVILWLIAFVGLFLTAIILGFANACAEAAGEETIYLEPEDFE